MKNDGKLECEFDMLIFGFQPTSLATLSLTESALSRHNQTEEEVWTGGPFSQFEAINGQNRYVDSLPGGVCGGSH